MRKSFFAERSLGVIPVTNKKVNLHVIQNSKRVYLILATLILLCVGAVLTSCSVADEVDTENTPVLITADVPSTISVSNISGLSLTTGQKEYFSADTQIAYSLENSTDTEYGFGAGSISIEVLQDEKWYSLAFRTDIGDIVVHDVLTVVLPHSTHTGTKSFYLYGDCVPVGTYRLVIGLAPANNLGGSTTEYLVAEFSIVE